MLAANYLQEPTGPRWSPVVWTALSVIWSDLGVVLRGAIVGPYGSLPAWDIL